MAKTFDIAGRGVTEPTQIGLRLKQRLGQQRPLLGGVVFELIRPFLAKIYRHAGFDFIFADNEHVLMSGRPEMADFILAAKDNGLPIIAKIPEPGRTEVARLLDAGVVGIQLPRTESREQLEQLIDYVKFSPAGSRAGAPLFGNVDYSGPCNYSDWLKEANSGTLIVAHIETALGYKNFESIVSTPRLDMVYVGPFDFSIAMGHPGDYEHPDVAKPMSHVLEMCLKHRVPFGTTVSNAEIAAQWVRRGCSFFHVVDELSLLRKGTADAVDAYRLACDENLRNVASTL